MMSWKTKKLLLKLNANKKSNYLPSSVSLKRSWSQVVKLSKIGSATKCKSRERCSCNSETKRGKKSSFLRRNVKRNRTFFSLKNITKVFRMKLKICVRLWKSSEKSTRRRRSKLRTSKERISLIRKTFSTLLEISIRTWSLPTLLWRLQWVTRSLRKSSLNLIGMRIKVNGECPYFIWIQIKERKMFSSQLLTVNVRLLVI